MNSRFMPPRHARHQSAAVEDSGACAEDAEQQRDQRRNSRTGGAPMNRPGEHAFNQEPLRSGHGDRQQQRPTGNNAFGERLTGGSRGRVGAARGQEAGRYNRKPRQCVTPPGTPASSNTHLRQRRRLRRLSRPLSQGAGPRPGNQPADASNGHQAATSMSAVDPGHRTACPRRAVPRPGSSHRRSTGSMQWPWVASCRAAPPGTGTAKV